MADISEKYPLAFDVSDMDDREFQQYMYVLDRMLRAETHITYLYILILVILINMTAVITMIAFHIVKKEHPNLTKADIFCWPWNKSKRNQAKKMEEGRQSTNQSTNASTANDDIEIDILKVE